MAAQQQLPQAVELRETDRRRPFGPRLPLLQRQRRIVGRADLGQRHPVHRFQQRAEHPLRIGAAVILPPERRQRIRRIARQHRREQRPHRAAIG